MTITCMASPQYSRHPTTYPNVMHSVTCDKLHREFIAVLCSVRPYVDQGRHTSTARTGKMIIAVCNGVCRSQRCQFQISTIDCGILLALLGIPNLDTVIPAATIRHTSSCTEARFFRATAGKNQSWRQANVFDFLTT